MNHKIKVKGTVKQGYGVASGRNADPRFPQGTIALQRPFFRQQGLNLDRYFPGTINLSIAPYQYKVQTARYTFRNLQWSPDTAAEDFSFLDCRIFLDSGQVLDGFVYYPHPETKPEHFQSPDILEIMTTPIESLQYGDALIIELDCQQISILS